MYLFSMKTIPVLVGMCTRFRMTVLLLLLKSSWCCLLCFNQTLHDRLLVHFLFSKPLLPNYFIFAPGLFGSSRFFLSNASVFTLLLLAIPQHCRQHSISTAWILLFLFNQLQIFCSIIHYAYPLHTRYNCLKHVVVCLRLLLFLLLWSLVSLF